MYDLEKEKLKLFGDYIVRILRPSYIKGFMTTYLETEIVEKILSEENTSVTNAAKTLLEKMCILEEQGWFQAFLDALCEGEYTGLCDAIREWDFEIFEQMRTCRTLLERIEPSFTKHIKPVEILTHMRECFMTRECEEIKAIDEQKGHIAAAEKLTECLKRSDKTNWFKVLKLTLHNCNYNTALELLDPDEDVVKPINECVNGETTSVSFHYTEEPDLGVLTANPATDSCHRGRDGSTEPGPGNVKERKTLREYQKELAAPAFQGENTIICAPTGCGKTLVALAISEHHLKCKPRQPAKIVFMATKKEVYDQQYRLFSDYFSGTANIRVTGIHGEMEDKVSMDVVVENHEIIVLTPQILLNALISRELPSLSVFTLLIFDECHNATGKHPYNMLMSRYLDSKLGRGGECLPQVVGLTASVGIGTFKNKLEAKTNICQLCANLDVRVISTVKDNKEELSSFVHVPKKEFEAVEKRQNDPFITIINGIMANIESYAQSMHDIESLSSLYHSDRGTQKYEQWIVDVQKKCKVLQLEDKEEEGRICRALFNCTEYLRKYNDALIINEDARIKDALNYLEAFFEQVRKAGFDETERKLTAYFDTQYHHLVQLSQSEDGENPKLSELKFILHEEYRQNDQTRTLLFVRTRALADSLKNWIEETESLKFLKPGVLIGRKNDITGSGMTLTSQKGVLQSFKTSDQSKILIATSVADEGIDIPQCNLVIMYEYSGNVIKTIQVRGRGRAEGSKCVLISSKKERIEKEKENLRNEELVDEAVALLQSSREEMLGQIEFFQKEDKLTREYIRQSPEKPRGDHNNRLLCAKCKGFACFSDDLRVLKGSQHIAIDRTIFERSVAKPHGQPKMYMGITKLHKLLCAACKQDWGIVASYLAFDSLPVLKIESFVVENCATKQQSYFRKWKEITFTIKAFDMTELLPR